MAVLRFKIVDVGADSVTIVSAPLADKPKPKERKIGKTDFARVYSAWPDYCGGQGISYRRVSTETGDLSARKARCVCLKTYLSFVCHLAPPSCKCGSGGNCGLGRNVPLRGSTLQPSTVQSSTSPEKRSTTKIDWPCEG